MTVRTSISFYKFVIDNLLSALLAFFADRSYSVNETDQIVEVCVVLEGLTEKNNVIVLSTLNSSASCMFKLILYLKYTYC